MLTLGIDPGSSNLGFGLVKGDNDPELVHYGCLTTPTGKDQGEKLHYLFKNISDLLTNNEVTDVSVEQLVYGRNVSSAASVWKTMGVVQLAATQHGLSVVEYSPPQIKQAVTGSGRASKKDVQQMVKIILGMQDIPKPDHAADALATAICHLQNHRLKRLQLP